MSNERLIAAADQFKRLLLDNKLLVIAVVCTTVYLGILDNVLESETMKLDEAAYWLIVENLRQPWLTPIMESFSNLATPVTIVVLWIPVTAFAPGKELDCAWGEPDTGSCPKSSNEGHRATSPTRGVSPCRSQRFQFPIRPLNGCYGIFRLTRLVRLALRERQGAPRTHHHCPLRDYRHDRN